jgi:hypothetical protein
MKNKYNQYGSYIDVESYKYGDYQNYGEYSSKEFNELVNNMYIDHFESKEDRLKREAKEKAEKRNSKIDQILGE